MLTTRRSAIAGLAAVISVTCSVVTANAGEALDRVTNSGVLKVATNSDYPPNSFMNDNNELDGFDILVAKEIGKRMGVDVEFVTPGWEVMTAGRWSGRWDMVIGSMTPTTARAEVLDFPALYYFSPAVFAVHKDSAATKVSDLDGKVVGVVSASTYQRYLEHDLNLDVVGMPEFTYDVTPGEIRTYTEVNEFDDLSLGDGRRIHAVLQSLPVVTEAVNKGLPVKQLGDPVFYEPLAVVTDKGDADMNARLAEVVTAMTEDGTLAALSVKWHGVDLVTTK
ncbi:transporter substrate-binding domain-containing protein [Sulfitobacter sp. F26204]|uniref:transporter substrate-binding domain-containing protein n=1 Tax=Sulfitobacter sp. F26204 TaxID=2996014 RepID=UPI00225DF203|nr:transporter substrate-binding domain-containing protein [Sulfitobacter sp. F26204]MCX7561206.1 transporter substrate-binding domain-containing protein [Sulfitobacter sp. F26204]